jgi:hypothetical protein
VISARDRNDGVAKRSPAGAWNTRAPGRAYRGNFIDDVIQELGKIPNMANIVVQRFPSSARMGSSM